MFKQFESSICPPYQRYFAGYDNSVAYTEELKNDNDFNIFLQVRPVEELFFNHFITFQVLAKRKQKKYFIIISKKNISSVFNNLTIPVKRNC